MEQAYKWASASTATSQSTEWTTKKGAAIWEVDGPTGKHRLFAISAMITAPPSIITAPEIADRLVAHHMNDDAASAQTPAGAMTMTPTPEQV
jgi:hypothetical protein